MEIISRERITYFLCLLKAGIVTVSENIESKQVFGDLWTRANGVRRVCTSKEIVFVSVKLYCQHKTNNIISINFDLNKKTSFNYTWVIRSYKEL